jgi:hypothetical protein
MGQSSIPPCEDRFDSLLAQVPRLRPTDNSDRTATEGAMEAGWYEARGPEMVAAIVGSTISQSFED